MMKVGYLGPAGTFSHAALLASSWPDPGAEAVPCESEREAIIGVQDGALDSAIVPIENAIEGGVNATIDALIHEATDVSVLAEELLPVSHSLIVAPGTTLDEVTEVLSHAQPLGQCRRNLAQFLPGRPVRAVSSTAEAVRIVATSSAPLAAVGPSAAADTYGAIVLEDHLEDFAGNTTRFWWVGREGGTHPADRGDFKTSLVFGGDGDGEPGWLLRTLAVFADRGLNLTRIESRPSREHLGHYLFLIDVAGHADTGALADAIAELKTRGSSIRVLGSYRPASPAPPA
jgi:prephenate dehydratase